MAGEIVPEVAGAGSVHIGFTLLQRKFIGDRALVIVGAFLAAIGDLPGLLVVVAGDGGVRPVVAVARDFAAVIKIVQHSELQSQLVQVGSDIRAVHGQRRIAVAHFPAVKFQIAKTWS